jgi:hypothetical protein
MLRKAAVRWAPSPIELYRSYPSAFPCVFRLSGLFPWNQLFGRFSVVIHRRMFPTLLSVAGRPASVRTVRAKS